MSLQNILLMLNDKLYEYNWLITNYECYPQNKKILELLAFEHCWISGEELMQIMVEDEFQWIWGVFSGFRKEIGREDILTYSLPYANGNINLWMNPISIQHPLADIEIVAWDGELTLCICKDDTIIKEISTKFNNAIDLETYNNSII